MGLIMPAAYALARRDFRQEGWACFLVAVGFADHLGIPLARRHGVDRLRRPMSGVVLANLVPTVPPRQALLRAWSPHARC